MSASKLASANGSASACAFDQLDTGALDCGEARAGRGQHLRALVDAHDRAVGAREQLRGDHPRAGRHVEHPLAGRRRRGARRAPVASAGPARS